MSDKGLSEAARLTFQDPVFYIFLTFQGFWCFYIPRNKLPNFGSLFRPRFFAEVIRFIRFIPAGIYSFRIKIGNTRTIPGVVLVSLLLTLNIFHTLFYCFYC